jgi:hypothetical protein
MSKSRKFSILRGPEQNERLQHDKFEEMARDFGLYEDKSMIKELSQHDKFIAMVRDLGGDEDETTLKKMLAMITKQKSKKQAT